MDDDELIAAVARGDDAGLPELFSRHAPWLAARLCGVLPAAEVEDLLQETFLAGCAATVILVPANATTSAANFTAAITGTIHAAITQDAAVVSISGSHGEHLFTPAQVASI